MACHVKSSEGTGLHTDSRRRRDTDSGFVDAWRVPGGEGKAPMYSALRVWIAFLLAVAAGTQSTPPASAQTVPSAQSAYAYVEHLAGSIGPRVAGTPASQAAAEYAAAQLR